MSSWSHSGQEQLDTLLISTDNIIAFRNFQSLSVLEHDAFRNEVSLWKGEERYARPGECTRWICIVKTWFPNEIIWNKWRDFFLPPKNCLKHYSPNINNLLLLTTRKQKKKKSKCCHLQIKKNLKSTKRIFLAVAQKYTRSVDQEVISNPLSVCLHLVP